MNSEEKRNRMICGSCRHTFDYRDAATVYRKLYGKEIPEKRCPLCGGIFRVIELPNDLDNYLYVNDDERYYTYKQ